MPMVMTQVGLDALRLRLRALDPALRRAVQVALIEHAEATRQALSDAAPKGAGGGSAAPFAGDTSGHLADSFSATSPAATVAQVKTSQPAKLGLLLSGTGIYGPRGQRITPRVKKALAWEAAEHPYRSVRGMRPNHFLYPVLDQAAAEASPKVSAAVSAALRALGL